MKPKKQNKKFWGAVIGSILVLTIAGVALATQTEQADVTQQWITEEGLQNEETPFVPMGEVYGSEYGPKSDARIVRSPNVYFYKDCSYQGARNVIAAGHDVTWVENDHIQNDSISAIIVQAGAKLTIFWDINYGGRSAVIIGPAAIPCLTRQGWNDQISSFKVETYYACFYQDCNRGGQQRCLTRGNQPWVPRVGIRNDDLSSISVAKGITVRAYKDSQQRGTSLTITGPFFDQCLVRQGFNDTISSIKVQASEACFQQNCNQGGYEKCLGQGNYPWVPRVGIRNDDLSSMKIPAGVEVTVYWDANYGGRQLTMTGPHYVSCLVQAGWNDQISSIRVRMTT